LAFHHLYIAKINQHFLEGTFTDGLKLIPEIKVGLETYKHTLDQHRILVFYYKIASMYFGSGDTDHAIDYLNKIINLRVGNLRGDIQCFARLLHLIAHFEKGHFGLLEYLIKSVYRFIAKNEDLSLMMQEILKFLRKSLYLKQKDIKPAFAQLRDRLVELSENPYEKRSFLYLDFISWLEAKVDGKLVQEVMREKFLERNK
jgi:tetratricopeptide (TPR) repeat protein